MSVQLLEGLPLLVGGAVALHADCCCDDPCIECNVCPTCWSSDEDPCSGIGSITATVSGVTNGTSSCGCTGINGAYVISPQDDGCIEYFEYIIDRCAITTSSRYSMMIRYNLAFNPTDDYTITDVTSLIACPIAVGLGATFNSKVCNSFTLSKGHYVVVQIYEWIGQPGSPNVIAFNSVYMYSWGNSTIKPGCPDDQVYGLCSLLEAGGVATHVFSQRYLFGTPVATSTCSLGEPAACDFSGISITIGAPDIDAETPPPPPP